MRKRRAIAGNLRQSYCHSLLPRRVALDDLHLSADVPFYSIASVRRPASNFRSTQ